eukprot:COSAG05_NODE_258_length_12741_cov_168.778279_4_plen_44_part_00
MVWLAIEDGGTCSKQIGECNLDLYGHIGTSREAADGDGSGIDK